MVTTRGPVVVELVVRVGPIVDACLDACLDAGTRLTSALERDATQCHCVSYCAGVRQIQADRTVKCDILIPWR